MLIHNYADVLNTPNIYYNRGLIQSVLRGLIFVVCFTFRICIYDITFNKRIYSNKM